VTGAVPGQRDRQVLPLGGRGAGGCRIVDVFPQQWWSFAGDSDRPATSQLNLQPSGAYFFGDGWNVGYSGNILANGKAASYKDVWTVPIGLGVGKVLKLWHRASLRLTAACFKRPLHRRERPRGDHLEA
jgi:hypothetical protein